MDFFKEDDNRPLAPGVFLGWQETGIPEMPDFELFNVTGPFTTPSGKHYNRWVHTISRKELERFGYRVPYIPKDAEPNTPISVFDEDMIKTETNKILPYSRDSKAKKHNILKPCRWQVNNSGQLVKTHR